MGRYYNGDIEGKFWFAVQASDDADFFGGQQGEPNYIQYNFSEDDLPTIKKGLKECFERLKTPKSTIKNIYKVIEDKKFDDETFWKFFKDTDNKKKEEWLARLDLGLKIFNSVKNTGYCNFEAEL